MNLAEVMAAAIVLATASGGSLQIWAASASASRTVEQRRELLVRLDGALLAAEARLRQPLFNPSGLDCALAAAAMAELLATAPGPEAVQRQIDAQAHGVWLRLQADPLPARQRWFDAAALGQCAPDAPGEPAAPGEPGADPANVVNPEVLSDDRPSNPV